MGTLLVSLIFISALLSVQCNPLLSTSLASEPPPPPLHSPNLPASGKMEVKWEPFRDIFENIIRPIGGENNVTAMLEHVKEEDINELEGTLLDKAKDDPVFVEQILTQLIHIRERYIKLRKDWQKTIEDRDKTAKIFKARIVDTHAEPTSLLPSVGQPVQFTQSFTPNTGLTNVSPIRNLNPPITTPRPAPHSPIFTTVIIPDEQHFTVSSETLPDSLPPQLDQEEVEEDSSSFLGPLSHSSTPSDFFFVPNHVIDPLVDSQQIHFDTAIPQFASRGSPPAPPPHVAARRATAAPLTWAPTTTTTRRPTRPWHFSSRATTTRRPETVPWWWTKTTTPVPTTTTTVSTTTREAERSETKAGIHYDHTNNRTVYRYFWKPNAEEEAVIPEMIDENGNEHSAVPIETEQQITQVPTEEAFEEFHSDPPSPSTTNASPPPPTTQSTTHPQTTQSTTLPPPLTTAGPQRPPQVVTVPEFAPRQPQIIRDPRLETQFREEIQSQHQQQRSHPQSFQTATGSGVFVVSTVLPHVPSPSIEEPLEIGLAQHPLEPWAPTQRPTSISTTTIITTTAPSTTTRVETTTTTEIPPTTTTEEAIAEVPSVPEFASTVEDISQLSDELSEQSVDERELINILNREETQRGVTQAKWFSGAANAFDKDQEHLSGSPKRFIPEFPGEVDPDTFPEGDQKDPEAEEGGVAETPQHIVITVQPTFAPRPPTEAPTTTIEQSTVTFTTPITTITDLTEEQFEETTVEGPAEQIDDTTETFTDEVLEETAEELSQAFADFERAVSTQTTEGPTEPPSTVTVIENLVTAPQQRPVLLQGLRAPSVVVWGRRPPKQPSTILHLDTAPPSIRPTRKPKKKTTKIPDEISLLDELIRDKTEMATSTQLATVSFLENELKREAKIQNFFDEEPGVRTSLPEAPHSEARVRGRTPGRKIRGKGHQKRVETSQFLIGALNREDLHLTNVEARIALGLPGRASNPRSRPSIAAPDPAPAVAVNDAIQLLVQDLQRERELLSRGFDEKTYAACNAINCNFEKDDLCQYESSLDELIFGDDAFRRRRKRSALDSFVVRSWTNWGGARGDPALGNIALASGRSSPSDVFSQGKNERFAATQVNPNQMAMMSTQINATESLRILFDAWEGMRGVQLRVCCDAVCPFETELGVKRGSRNWLQREVICPVGTRQLSFECTNTGKFRGACGVDNIRMYKC